MTDYEFIFDGFERAHVESTKHPGFGYFVSGGLFSSETKKITLNFDVLLEAAYWDCGGWCHNTERCELGGAIERCRDEIVNIISSTLEHEHIHKAIDSLVLDDSVNRGFDRILPKLAELKL